MLGSGCGDIGQAPEQPQPNVLVIYADEHSWWTLEVYGSDLAGTPNIDRIGREGAIFQNFFVNSAVCTPSRGCLLTGRYPHAHGAYSNNLPINQDEVSLAHLLRREGYETAFAGKWRLDGEGKPGWLGEERALGFEDTRWMYNRGHWKRIVERPEGSPRNRSVVKFGSQSTIADEPDGRPDVDYAVDVPGEFFTDWIADKCIEFVREERSKPFFYFLSIPDPHTQWTVRAPYDTMYDPAEMPVPETLCEAKQPDWAARAREQWIKRDRARSWDDPIRERRLREAKARYCGQVKCVDDNVARILEALDETGQLDNTLIVFTSDHGQYIGEHGLYMKNRLYETAHRVALLMRLPGTIPAGTSVTHCVSTADVQPTICGLLGTEPSEREQGSDASRPARGEDDPGWADEAFINHSSLERAGIFMPEWEFALVKDGDGILFDRRSDPAQTRNLFEDSEYAPVVEELRGRVRAHNRAVKSPAAAWLG